MQDFCGTNIVAFVAQPIFLVKYIYLRPPMYELRKIHSLVKETHVFQTRLFVNWCVVGISIVVKQLSTSIITNLPLHGSFITLSPRAQDAIYNSRYVIYYFYTHKDSHILTE